jgi:DNA mismatch endonuclease, patch repair protein
MARIKGRHTKPELLVRRALHARGLRYRLHGQLPGRPDIVFTRFRAVIFIHGCFWHGHDCELFRLPSSRTEFWHKKIVGNRRRDEGVLAELSSMGWRVLTIWECSLRGRGKIGLENVTDRALAWLATKDRMSEIRGIGHARH